MFVFFYYFLVNRTYVSIVPIKTFYVFPIEQLLEVYKSNFYTWVNQFNLTNALSLTKLYHWLLSLSLHRLSGEDMEGGGFGVEATLLSRV